MARRPPEAHPARFPRAIAVLAAAATLTTGLVLVGTPAHAQSVRSIKAEVAAAERQLTALNTQAEIAAERYNAGRIKLAAAQHSASSAQHNLAQAQAKLTKLQSSVQAFAVAAYRGNNSTALMALANGSTQQFLARESSVQAISASEQQTIASVAAAQRGQEQAQADANAALAVQRGATAALASEKQKITAAADKEQSILAGLQDKERQIIKAAKARAAREAARRAAARLAAERAAAAQAAAQLASQPVNPPAPQPVAHIPASGGASTAVAWAYQEIGKPYVWAAAGPNSFDCSGLTQYVWAKAGVYLGHYTGDQWNEGSHVDRSQLEPGDLVFFAYNTSDPSTIHHVGIYVGGGEMIDAPYTGAYVRKESAFRSDYIGAVRPG
jgi:cell wall-associated NlpC family hydrolase